MHVSDRRGEGGGGGGRTIIVLVCLVEATQEVKLRTEHRKRIARILFKNETIPDEALFNAVTTKIFEHRHVRNGTSKQWTFFGAFYFSTLVVTLIGKYIIIQSLTYPSPSRLMFRIRSNNT